MKVFITGASGFIGSAITSELLKNGHRVIGLTHSDEGVKKLQALGVEICRGNIIDSVSLRNGIENADGIIHCAYMPGFDKFEEASRQESAAVEVLGSYLSGSSRPFLITSVAAMGISIPGRPGTEGHFDPNPSKPRYATELAAASVAEKGCQVSIVRIPQVHNVERLGIVSSLIKTAREKGVSAYQGEGNNRWAAAHLLDIATVYRLVLEKNEPGIYHAVAEEGIPLIEIAKAIAEGLNVPAISLSADETQKQFGPLSMFMGVDMSASSNLTRERLRWEPRGPGLIEDLKNAF